MDELLAGILDNDTSDTLAAVGEMVKKIFDALMKFFNMFLKKGDEAAVTE